MRKLLILTLALLLCLVTVAPRTRVAAAKHKRNPALYAPGEIIVKLKANAAELQVADPLERELAVGQMVIQSANRSAGRAAEPLINQTRQKRMANILATRGLDRTFVLKLGADADIDTAIAELRARDDVEYAEPNYRIELGSVIPSDPRFFDQWPLKNFGYSINEWPATMNADIKIGDAWEITKGSPDVLVAVTDTGIDALHPDLVNSIYTNPNEIPGNGIDDDGNGYIDDVHGYNVGNMNNDTSDVIGHGTEISAVIAAGIDDGIGIAGISRAKIIPVRFFKRLSPEPFDIDATIVDATRALVYAAASGAQIINASWRTLFAVDSISEDEAKALEDAVLATNDAGALLVCIAGNEGYNNDFTKVYPGAFQFPNEIVVAASDYNDEIWHDLGRPAAINSGFGPKTVALAAPGVSIATAKAHGICSLCSTSSDPADWYTTSVENNNGTSFSAAFVSGVAALVKSRYPDDDVLHLKARILQGVDVRDSLRPYVTTGGRLNAFGALTVEPQVTITPPTLTRLKYKSGGGGKMMVYGSGIQPGARLIIGDKKFSTTAKKADLSQMVAIVPKSALPKGVATPIKLRNLDGGESSAIDFTR